MADPDVPVEPGGQEGGGGEPGGGGGGALAQDRYVPFVERFPLRAPRPERFTLSQNSGEDDMQLFSYHSYGDTSDEVATIVEGVTYIDTADPAIDTEVAEAWTGYNDGDELDGAGGTKPELRYYQHRLGDLNAFVKIILAGQEIPANGIPMRCANSASANKKLAKLIRNVPKERKIVTECVLVYKRPGLLTPIVFKYQQAIG